MGCVAGFAWHRPRVSTVGVSVTQAVWLRAGSIAAYTTSAGEAYLVDLSGAAPRTSKLAVSGAAAGSLTPSPNGRSLSVGTNTFDTAAQLTRSAISYVTWADGLPKSVPLFQNDIASDVLQFSYDGRFGVNAFVGGSRWWNLTSPSPTSVDLGYVFYAASWHPTAQALLFRGENPSPALYRGIIDGGTMISTPLVQGTTCKPTNGPWSPDGKQALLACDSDLRGINGPMTSPPGADFSLLPLGFLANSFTYIASFGWSPDSKWVVLRVNHDVKEQFDLHLIRWSTPGVAYKAHTNTVAPGVTTWAFAQNSQTIAFVGTVAPQDRAGLYLTRLPGSGAPPAISCPRLSTRLYRLTSIGCRALACSLTEQRSPARLNFSRCRSPPTELPDLPSQSVA